MSWEEYRNAKEAIRNNSLTYINSTQGDVWDGGTMQFGIDEGGLRIRVGDSNIGFTIADTERLIEGLQRVLPLMQELIELEATRKAELEKEGV